MPPGDRPTYDGATAETLADALALPRVVILEETDSTLDVAHSLAEQGSPSGTLVVADAQRAGRGRMGRSWTSLPGQGVWATLIERPTEQDALDVLSIRIGVGLAELLDPIARETVRVKWPNDLELALGKLGGILCETRWAAGGSSPGWVAIGVGVNVVMPEAVADAAGLPAGTSRLDVLGTIVRAVRSAASARGHLSHAEQDRFRRRDALAGRRLVSPARGTVAGIDAAGGLVVITPRGRETHRTGTVELDEEPSR